MTSLASPDNLLSMVLQVLCITVVAEAISAGLRVTAPGLRYGFWRAVLLLCLAFPWLQSPQHAVTRVVVPSGGDGMARTAVDVSAAGLAPASVNWMLVLVGVAVVGIGLRLSWLGIGLFRLRRLRGSGQPMPLADHAHLQQTMGTRADVRYVNAVRQPVTFGVRRPVVLLPAALADCTAATRTAVLAHELVHVRRRDWCWVIVEEIVRSAFWFQPALWWLVSRVQLAREEVVDATAVAITGDRREYLEALLAFADEVPLAPAPAFARRRHLFRRIVLLSREDVMSGRRVVLSALVMAIAVSAAGWYATSAFPLQAQAVGVLQAGIGPLEQSARSIGPDNPIPSRVYDETPVFPPEAAGEKVAVTVTLRTVVDASGTVAELRLGGFSFQLNGFSASMSGGADTLKQFEQFAEKAAFRTDSQGPMVGASTFRPLLLAFIESAATAVQRWRFEPPRESPVAFDTIVQFLSDKPVVTRTVAPTGGNVRTDDGALRVGGGIKPPMKVKDVRPVYPQEARDARVQGVVIAELRIEADGKVGSARVLRSIPLLDQAALDAVTQWEFMPTLLNGAPVPVIMTVTVQFMLE